MSHPPDPIPPSPLKHYKKLAHREKLHYAKFSLTTGLTSYVPIPINCVTHDGWYNIGWWADFAAVGYIATFNGNQWGTGNYETCVTATNYADICIPSETTRASMVLQRVSAIIDFGLCRLYPPIEIFC